jgi:hypothetical protein
MRLEIRLYLQIFTKENTKMNNRRLLPMLALASFAVSLAFARPSVANDEIYIPTREESELIESEISSGLYEQSAVNALVDGKEVSVDIYGKVPTNSWSEVQQSINILLNYTPPNPAGWVCQKVGTWYVCCRAHPVPMCRIPGTIGL